jgi:hypothetical protein
LKNNDPWDVPILREYAIDNNIPILEFDRIAKDHNKYFLGISARFSRILPGDIISCFENGIVNFHGGLLPEYGGLFSTCHAILNNSEYGGGTIHYIDEGIDTGKIIKRCEVKISEYDTSISLFKKTQSPLFENFKQILPKLINGEKLLEPVSNKNGKYYDKNSLLGKKEIKFNNTNFEEIYTITRAFDFPRRASNDFRYNKALGGGALLDAGGYTIKYASMLLGESAKIVQAQSNIIDEFEVDIAGSAVMVNENGITAQIAFGMDNSYKCDLEVWGSKGSLFTGRVLTAPTGFVPELIIMTGNETKTHKLPADDAFKKSILHFKQCIEDDTARMNNYKTILKQAQLVNQFTEKV